MYCEYQLMLYVIVMVVIFVCLMLDVSLSWDRGWKKSCWQVLFCTSNSSFTV